MRQIPEDDPIKLPSTATGACEPQSSERADPVPGGLLARLLPVVTEQDPSVGLERLPHSPFKLPLQLTRPCLRDGLEDEPLVQRKTILPTKTNTSLVEEARVQSTGANGLPSKKHSL